MTKSSLQGTYYHTILIAQVKKGGEGAVELPVDFKISEFS
jgi:hypothetical protein